MSTCLDDLVAYIAGSSTITTAIAASNIWTGLIPDEMSGQFPRAVIIPLGMHPEYVTNGDLVATFSFQVSVFDTNPDYVETICGAFCSALDYSKISALTISCERTSGPTISPDTSLPQKVYMGVLEYDLLQNRTKGGT